MYSKRFYTYFQPDSSSRTGFDGFLPVLEALTVDVADRIVLQGSAGQLDHGSVAVASITGVTIVSAITALAGPALRPLKSYLRQLTL